MGMEIDSLEIAIQAQAKAAASEVDVLYQKLDKVANVLSRTSSGYRTAAKEAGRLSAAFKSIASIRIPDFSNLIQQLSMLSKIDLKALTSKKIDIDIGVNAPKSAEQVRWAIQKAADEARVDSDKIAKQLIDTYRLTGHAKASMKSAVAAMTAELAKGFDGSGFTNNVDVFIKYSDKLADIIRKNGSVIATSVGDEERILQAFAGNSSFVIDRVTEDMEKIRSTISEIKNERVAGAVEDQISNSFQQAIDGAQDKIRGGFENAMKIASHELTLDVQVNQDKIVRDIQDAIYKASKAEFTPVDVTLKVNKQGITDSVTKELQSISTGNLPAVSAAYERLFSSLMNVHTVLGNSNSINNVVNALTRLTNVDLRQFDIEKFNEIIKSIESLQTIGDIAAPVAKLVSAFARLANVGEMMTVTASAIPELANRLREAFDIIANANISEATERVMSAFTRLALSGEKAATAAANLPGITAVIKDFFASMAAMPAINDTTLRMVEAFTALATTGKRIGSVGTQVSKALTKVNDTGEQTVKTFENVGTHSNKVLDAFKKLISACGNAVRGIGSGVSKMISHFKTLGNGSSHIQKATLSLKNLIQVALGFYGIRTLLQWGKDAVAFASDLTEVQNVVENSFGTKGTQAVEKFADTAIKKFGMTELTAKRISSRFQAMGNAMGITSGQVAKATQNIADGLGENSREYDKTGDSMGAMSLNLTKLAADMASFYNVEQDTVAEALNAVYTGQTRPLRQYGLDLTQATLQEWALKHGIDAKVSSMTQAEKTLLRYQYVMAQTSTVQGDFLRTQDTWANQTRILKQNLQALGGVIGGTLINAFKPLVTWLNKAMASVIAFAETVGNALGKIFGWKILHTPASNAADAYDTLADGMDNAADSSGDAADGIDKATKAAEKYKNTVLGFDELNILNGVNDNSSSSSGNGGGSGNGSGAGGGIADATGADFEIIKGKSWLEEYESEIDSLYELGAYISKVLTDMLEGIKWDEIYGKARGFGTGLADFLNGLITPELFSALGGTIAGAVNTALNAADAFLDEFDFTNLGDSLAAGVNRFFDDFDFGLAASVFYKAINGLADVIIAAGENTKWGNIGRKISECVRIALGGIEWKNKVFKAADTFGSNLADFLNGLIKPSTFWKIGETVGNVLKMCLHILDTFGHTFEFTKFGESLASAINGFLETWDPGLTADTFTTLADGILDAAIAAVGGIEWFDLGYKIRESIINIKWDNLLFKVGTLIMNAINSGLTVADGLFDGTPVVNVIEELRDKINGIAEEMDLPSVASAIGDLVTALTPAVSGFAQGFIDVFGSLGELGASAIKGIGEGLQVVADAINSVDPAILETIGNVAGRITAAVIGISIADKGVTALQGIIGTLTGTGVAATIGETATSIGETATATGAVASNATKATNPVSSFIKWFIGAADPAVLVAGGIMAFAESVDTARYHAAGGTGPITDFWQAIEGMRGTLSEDLISKLENLAIEFANNGIEGDEAAQKLAAFFTEENINPEKIELALASVSESLGNANPFIDTIRQSFSLMGDDAKEAAEKASMSSGDYSNLRTTLHDLAEKGIIPSNDHLETLLGTLDRQYQSSSSAEGAYSALRDEMDRLGISTEEFDKLVSENVPGAFDSIKTGAEDADKKTGSLWTGILGFAGGAFAQSLLMAVLGTSFDTMGTKAEDAETPIEGLKTTIGGFIKKVGDYAKDATGYGEDITGNLTQGMVDAMEDQRQGLLTSLDTTFVTDPKTELEKGWGIHSPSTVTYGYGKNIIAGMKNAIKDQGNTLVTEITNIISKMQTKITGKYKDFETAGKKLAQSIKTGFTSVSFSTLTSAITNAINFTELNDTFEQAGKNAIEWFASGMYSTYIKTPHLKFTQTVSGDDSNKTTSWDSSVSWYEKGGFPNTGELFWARENGKPEMVGNIGGRTAVANNDDIVKAVSAGVAHAVAGVISSGMASGANSDPINEVIVKVDSETLYRAVKKGERKASGRYGTAVAIG